MVCFFLLTLTISEISISKLIVVIVLQFPLLHVLVVITFTHPTNSPKPFLSTWTISHYLWHICWFILPFVPCFTFWTLCPDYITHPNFPYKYWTQLPVQTTCSYLLISNKHVLPWSQVLWATVKLSWDRHPHLDLTRAEPRPWTLSWVTDKDLWVLPRTKTQTQTRLLLPTKVWCLDFTSKCNRLSHSFVTVPLSHWPWSSPAQLPQFSQDWYSSPQHFPS